MSQRVSERQSTLSSVPHRIKTLFHGMYGSGSSEKAKMELIHASPNVFRLKNFLTKGELDYFDKVCTIYNSKFLASFTESNENHKVLSELRTSTFIHLSKSQDKFVRAIEQRAADLAGLNSVNVEPLQIVSYRDGQQFEVHHDAGTLLDDDNTIDMVLPRRLVTIFVYLNSLPPGEGCTEFPQLNLKVTPKAGDAVMFCNVLSNGQPDINTIHQANPVAKGLCKYGVNIWLCDVSLQEYCHAPPKNVVTAAQWERINPVNSALSLANEMSDKYLLLQCQKQLNHEKKRKFDEVSGGVVEESEDYWAEAADPS